MKEEGEGKAKGDEVSYTKQDIRFTRSKDSKVLYIHALAFDTNYKIKCLGKSHIDLNSITSIQLLDSKTEIKFKQSNEHLTIKMPKHINKEKNAYTFKVSFKQEIPAYRQ